MHELSIAQAIVEQAAQVAAREGAQRIVSIAVVVGALSGVDADALSFAFPLAAEGTAAHGATLTIEPVPVRLRCKACGGEAEAEFPFGACQACGAAETEVVAGRELNIKSVEVLT